MLHTKENLLYYNGIKILSNVANCRLYLSMPPPRQPMRN